MDPVVVVGGGISGIACARVLADAGVEVTVLDRGRRIGGRMAVRTVDPVDTGASYCTVSDDRFATVVRDWRSRGLAHEWTDTFEVFDDGHHGEPKRGSMRWASPGGLRSLVEDLARGLVIERSAVEAVALDEHTGIPSVAGRRATAVVLAMPDPQQDGFSTRGSHHELCSSTTTHRPWRCSRAGSVARGQRASMAPSSTMTLTSPGSPMMALAAATGLRSSSPTPLRS